MSSNNPFDVHGIEHLSPSSINTFIDDKAMWIMRYLFGYKNGGGPAMWRGSAIDGGVGAYFGFEDKLYSTSECLDLVKLYYSTDRIRCKADFPKQAIDMNKYITEEERLERYFKTAINFYDDIGVPLDYQEKIELQLPDLPVPIIGYIDLLYENTIRDIKTTARTPSKVSEGHARQVSVYGKAKNCVPILDYIVVTAKEEKVVSFTVEDVQKHIDTVEQVAFSIMQFLSYSNDKYELANGCYPNIDDWKWGEDEINFAKTIWSIK
jgi:hypothetical protein